MIFFHQLSCVIMTVRYEKAPTLHMPDMISRKTNGLFLFKILPKFGFVIPCNGCGATAGVRAFLPAFASGYSNCADPNFETKNKGEYDCHYLHIHFRQKSSDIIANTKILISRKKDWD